MSLRQLKFKPKLQPSNIATGISNRCQATESKKEQNEKGVPETIQPSLCGKEINLTEANPPTKSLDNEKTDSSSLQILSHKSLTDVQNFQSDTTQSTKLKDTFGVSLRQLKFKPKLQTKNSTNNSDDTQQQDVKKNSVFEPLSPSKVLKDSDLFNAEPDAHIPVDSCIDNKLPLNEKADYVGSQPRKAENQLLENEFHSSKKTGVSLRQLKFKPRLQTKKSTNNKDDSQQPDVEKNIVFEPLSPKKYFKDSDLFNAEPNDHIPVDLCIGNKLPLNEKVDYVGSQPRKAENQQLEKESHSSNKTGTTGKPQLIHNHHKFRQKLNTFKNKIITSDSPTTKPCDQANGTDDKKHSVNAKNSLNVFENNLLPLSSSASEFYDLKKKGIQVVDGCKFKYGTYQLGEKLIDCVSSNGSHLYQITLIDEKAICSDKNHSKKDNCTSLPINEPPKRPSPSISEVFISTEEDTVASDKAFIPINKNLTLNSPRINSSANINNNRKEEQPSEVKSNKKNTSNVEEKLSEFWPKLNNHVSINTSHNVCRSKEALEPKKDLTLNEKCQSFFTSEVIGDKEESVNEEADLNIISPRILAQKRRKKRLSTSVKKTNKSKYFESRRSIEKLVEYNESSSDSVELNCITLNRNESNIDSVKSVQKSPFKPKLDDRSQKTCTTSTLGKFYSEAKQNYSKKFRNQVPDSSKLTMLDLIFYNPSSNPMPQRDRRRAEEPNVMDISDSEDNEKDSNTDSNKSDMSESNDSSEVPVPQLKLSADGKIVIAQESLVIEQSLGEISADIEVITDNNPKRKKKKRKARDKLRQAWSHEDTLKFYKALNSLGSDFETMKSVFPERSRGNLKSKFKKEEKVHCDLIDKVMSQHGEFNIEDVLDELEIEKRLADATTGKGIYLCKEIKGHRIPVKKRKRKGSLLSAKEITAILKGGNKKHIDENVQECESEESSTISNDHKRFCTDYKRPTRHLTKLLQILKQKNWRSDEEIQNNITTAIKSSNIDEKNEHFVISTNIEYEKVKYTKYITYNSNNLENPVEINETISHD